MPHAAAPAQRLYFLDWIRIIAFLVLILYHTGMYYVSWDWHVKSADAGHAIEPLMILSAPWRLGENMQVGVLGQVGGHADNVPALIRQCRQGPPGSFLSNGHGRAIADECSRRYGP